MVDFNDKLAFQNDYGLYFYHYEMKPLIWWQSGYKIRYVLLNIQKDFFHKTYMRFKDMSISDFENVFTDIKEIKIDD